MKLRDGLFIFITELQNYEIFVSCAWYEKKFCFGKISALSTSINVFHLLLR